ncbi:hypothetical protein C8Q76DRAFT_693732 [Earliella scabrosa]|nr:hypothetical protein C8Q76DRAFT_693732 [Earliella scabrosa]
MAPITYKLPDPPAATGWPCPPRNSVSANSATVMGSSTLVQQACDWNTSCRSATGMIIKVNVEQHRRWPRWALNLCLKNRQQVDVPIPMNVAKSYHNTLALIQKVNVASGSTMRRRIFSGLPQPFGLFPWGKCDGVPDGILRTRQPARDVHDAALSAGSRYLSGTFDNPAGRPMCHEGIILRLVLDGQTRD